MTEIMETVPKSQEMSTFREVGISPPQGQLAMSGGIFVCQSLGGEDATSIKLAEARDAAEHPYNAQGSFHQ